MFFFQFNDSLTISPTSWEDVLHSSIWPPSSKATFVFLLVFFPGTNSIIEHFLSINRRQFWVLQECRLSMSLCRGIHFVRATTVDQFEKLPLRKTMIGKSFMYIKKSGHKIEPWGTPDMMSILLERLLLIFTH